MDSKRTSGPDVDLTRRAFLATTSVAAAATAAAGRSAHARKSANEKLGVGVIGAGGRGGNHLSTWKWLKDNGGNVEVVALCDVYRPRLERAAEKSGVRMYMDYRELIADKRVDVVSIATPDHHHCAQAIAAVRAGKHVYCEKPVSHWRQFDLVKLLVEEVRKSRGTFLLGTQGMSDGAWGQMKQLIKDGLIGQPIHAECGYFRVGDWGEAGMPIDDPNAQPGPELDWEAFLGDSLPRPFDVSRFFRWRMYEDYAGGPVTDLYPHSLTPMLSILGVTMPTKVVATGGKFRYEAREVPDTFSMLIDYPERITVAVLGTQGNDYAGTGFRGAPGRVPVIRGWDGTLTIQENDIVFIPAEGSKKEGRRFPISHGENMGEYFRHFVDCIRAGRQDTLSSADLAYYTQTALIMGMLALRNETTVKFDAGQQKIMV